MNSFIVFFYFIQFAFCEVTHNIPVVTDPGPQIVLTDEEKNKPLFIYVDKAAGAQTMRVYEKGVLMGSYPVSTGREVAESNYKNPNFETYCSSTPVGDFRPRSMNELHLSNQWGGSKMYNAVFFQGGYAIHGVDENYYEQLGSRASGGCIRMTQENSKKVFDRINAVGMRNTGIKIVDSSSESERLNIQENCDNQMLVVRCAQEKLRSERYYQTNAPVQRTINGRTFTSFNVPFDYAYQKEEECRAELEAKGAFRQSMRSSPRPRPRPLVFPPVYTTEPVQDSPF